MIESSLELKTSRGTCEGVGELRVAVGSRPASFLNIAHFSAVAQMHTVVKSTQEYVVPCQVMSDVNVLAFNSQVMLEIWLEQVTNKNLVIHGEGFFDVDSRLGRR
jgi:hypothetical protein